MAAQRLSSDKRKEQIASVAAGLFAHKGFNGTTTREIAKKAKISEAILFRHFPTKEDLYVEIINQKIKIKPEMIDLETLKHSSTEEVLKGTAIQMFQQCKKDNTFIRLLIFSGLEDHKLAGLFFKARTNLLFIFLEGFFKEKIAKKELKEFDVKTLVLCFVFTFFHFILVKELFKLPEEWSLDYNQAVEQFVKIFLEGAKIQK